MDAPSITVIVPCFNAGQFLRETVESLIAQTRRDWEAVIVDDGSSDGSVEVAADIAAADERISCLVQPNGGVSAARCAGLAACRDTSRFLLFLDADDVLERTMLETLVGYLERTPKA